MSRSRSLLASVAAGVVLAGCGAGDAPPADLASPSAACEEAVATAAESAERAEPDTARSPDLDALETSLEECSSAEAWLTAVRGNPAALPLEMDRETALDLLCEDSGDTPVCSDWASSGSGAGTD